jgi:hypothetical protein
VYCNGGSDGQIILDATGGTGEYVALLLKDGVTDPVQQITFQTSGPGVFSRLLPGKYTVSLKDTNECIAKDDLGYEVIHPVTITEPLLPVKVELEHTTSPLAYDSQDGSATIRVGGGSPAPAGYITLFSHEGGQSYTPATSSTDGGDILYTFNGLGRGNHFVTIQDKNYALLAAEDKEAPCGCTALLNFYMTAPPPIVVEIEETHFINWYGGNQGVLMAHAKGGVPFPMEADMPYKYTWYKQDGAGVMQPLTMPNDSIAEDLTAGLYQVKVVDANGIPKTSTTYELTQPDPIAVQFSITQTGCYGDSSGKISAFISGGVEPYKYQWNLEGATGTELTGLEAGKYMLKVTDVRGGQLLSTAEVKSSSLLQVNAQVTQPTCLNLGAIRLDVSGATPPYTISWEDDGQCTDLVREELIPGNYRIFIKDANNCLNSYAYEITQPHSFTVSLGGDVTMCRDQTRVVEAVCREPNVTCEWFFNDEPLPTPGDQQFVDKAGVYRVRVTNPQGCFATDQIAVKISKETLELDMTVPTTIEVGTEIHAVNLSKISADRIEWKVPEEATIVERSDTELIFTLNKKGSYTLSMEGFKGEGATIVTRNIQVVNKGEVTLPDDKEPLIKQFWVTPNPSTGYFKVVVELNKAEDFTMELYSPAGVLMDTKEVQGVQSQTFEYEISGSLQGAYLLHLQTRADKSVLQIVIKR